MNKVDYLEVKHLLCCATPNVKGNWSIGVFGETPETSEAIYQVKELCCTNCGATYTFDVKQSCPIRQANEQAATLAVRCHKPYGPVN